MESSSAITDERTHAKHWRKPNLSLEIPSRTLDASRQELAQIKMPSTPTPTPKRVNFLLTPSTADSRITSSPGPSPSRGKLAIRNLFPKLNLKSRMILDEKITIPDSGPAVVPQEKVSISRSWSLTKMFTPRIKRTSSLPVTPIAHSNPESISGSISSSLTLGVSSLDIGLIDFIIVEFLVFLGSVILIDGKITLNLYHLRLLKVICKMFITILTL